MLLQLATLYYLLGLLTLSLLILYVSDASQPLLFLLMTITGKPKLAEIWTFPEKIFSSAAPRWSQYQTPQPGTTVDFVEEADVLETVRKYPVNRLIIRWSSADHVQVKYCVEHDLRKIGQGIRMLSSNSGVSTESLSTKQKTRSYSGAWSNHIRDCWCCLQNGRQVVN